MEHDTVPHERRHGSAVYRAPACQSLIQLRETTIKYLNDNNIKDFDIPSDEWIRLQFTPSNCWTERSKKFTKRFNVKMGIQTRLTRKHHPDQKYGVFFFNYFK